MLWKLSPPCWMNLCRPREVARARSCSSRTVRGMIGDTPSTVPKCAASWVGVRSARLKKVCAGQCRGIWRTATGGNRSSRRLTGWSAWAAQWHEGARLKILVLGKTGQLARELERGSWPQGWDVEFASRAAIDFAQPDAA